MQAARCFLDMRPCKTNGLGTLVSKATRIASRCSVRSVSTNSLDMLPPLPDLVRLVKAKRNQMKAAGEFERTVGRPRRQQLGRVRRFMWCGQWSAVHLAPFASSRIPAILTSTSTLVDADQIHCLSISLTTRPSDRIHRGRTWPLRRAPNPRVCARAGASWCFSLNGAPASLRPFRER